MTFKAELKASLGWDWNDGAVDNDRLDYVRQLLQGNGDGQAEAVWHAVEQTLLNNTSLTLDLTALHRTILGDDNVITLLTIKAILIVNHNPAGGSLVVGGAAANEWSAPFAAAGDQFVVPPDSPLLLGNRMAGWPVDSSHRNLKLAAAGGAVTYSLAILGTTTAPASGE
jgi:hypothetical protein